jgi:hypothetical protein
MDQAVGERNGNVKRIRSWKEGTEADTSRQFHSFLLAVRSLEIVRGFVLRSYFATSSSSWEETSVS